ncbi:hypothetical protein [Flavobacterium sp.]|uniref:hypothetical protein n=1 Tax=Flavobacterium sp. TaxID=239 RepID=UPI00286E3C81|nr:hypothetical protein [Flavobacterium sp.]
MKIKIATLAYTIKLLFIFSLLIDPNSAMAQAEHNLKMAFVVQKYDYELFNKVTNRSIANDLNTIQTNTATWVVNKIEKEIDSETTEFIVTFHLTKGFEKSAATLVEFQFDDWNKENYVLLPASAYNGNRFISRRIAYSPKLNEIKDIGKNKPMVISDVPRLNIANGVSHIQERSGSMASPSIGFHSINSKTGFFLTTTQKNKYGDLGINIEESRNRKNATISLCSPLVRELTQYRLCDNQAPTPDLPADFKEADEVEYTFRLHHFKAEKTQVLFDKYIQIRQELLPKSSFVPQIPFSSCFDILEKKFNDYNFVPKWGYYSVGPRNNYFQDWQIGWVGGMISTYPLLFSKNEQTRKNVIANFNWLFPNGISPSGFFWDSGEKGNVWIGGDTRKPLSKNWHLIRKSADALYYIIKQFDLMKIQGTTVEPVWENGTRTVADSFVKLWTKNGQFGQFVDSTTGEIAVGGSSSAAIAPAALVFASRYFNDKSYLNIACQSAQYMYDNFTTNGISCGGPGDALQNPDSESWYGMLESYAVLYEETKDKKWLTYASETANQYSTWVMSYDYVFPATSLWGAMDMKSTGAVFANTQNKHGSPGICTHSGLAFLRLYRATNNILYLNLLNDITQSIPQYMSRPDRPIKGMQEGWINERVSTTDWLEGIGEIFSGSTWAETSLLLTTTELPSIYVDVENKVVTAFDQLEVELMSSNEHRATLKITNRTKQTAEASVVLENKQQKSSLWQESKIFGKRKYLIQPNQTITIQVKN